MRVGPCASTRQRPHARTRSTRTPRWWPDWSTTARPWPWPAPRSRRRRSAAAASRSSRSSPRAWERRSGRTRMRAPSTRRWWCCAVTRRSTAPSRWSWATWRRPSSTAAGTPGSSSSARTTPRPGRGRAVLPGARRLRGTDRHRRCPRTALNPSGPTRHPCGPTRPAPQFPPVLLTPAGTALSGSRTALQVVTAWGHPQPAVVSASAYGQGPGWSWLSWLWLGWFWSGPGLDHGDRATRRVQDGVADRAQQHAGEATVTA